MKTSIRGVARKDPEWKRARATAFKFRDKN